MLTISFQLKEVAECGFVFEFESIFVFVLDENNFSSIHFSKEVVECGFVFEFDSIFAFVLDQNNF